MEDNPSDIGLTRRALAKSRIANELVVAEDGQEALDYLFAGGKYAGRDVSDTPALILLDLKLPGPMAWRCCAGSAPTSAPGACLWSS